MQCEFCAEEIKDAAILCRFCGARKEEDVWVAPPPPGGLAPLEPAGPERPPGFFTIRTAAAFFILSAALELASVTSSVPLFGVTRDGAPAVVYHLLFAALFAVVGVGLWRGTRWGYWMVFGVGLVYSLDKVQQALNKTALKGWLRENLAERGIRVGSLELDLFLAVTMLTFAMFVVGYWGFALYIYIRRAYFQQATDGQGEA